MLGCFLRVSYLGREEGDQDGGSAQIRILTTSHGKAGPDIIFPCFCAFCSFEHTGGKEQARTIAPSCLPVTWEVSVLYGFHS